MSKELIVRLLFAGSTALLMGLTVWLGYCKRVEKGRYRPIYNVVALPALVSYIIFRIYRLNFGRFTSAPICVIVLRFLVTAVFYHLLTLALTPRLRKRISAEGCAVLWVLPVELLFWCAITSQTIFEAQSRFLIALPRGFFRAVLGVWGAGFLFSLVWQIISHLRFRKILLKDAVETGDRERNLYWKVEGELDVSNKDRLPILRSPAASSPLTVGLVKPCLVLPQREDTDEELRLIFRHEILHLLHHDNDLKLVMAVICSAGWFIPSLWVSVRKAAEDAELCCDEMAVDGMNEERRRQYANLLLKNAGTARGFTTCLSASASGLRYRMTRVLRPEKRRLGLPLIMVLSALFAFCFGLVGFGVKAGTVHGLLFDRQGGDWHVSRVVTRDGTQGVSHTDPAVCAAVETALADMELVEMMDWDVNDLTGLDTLTLTRNGDNNYSNIYLMNEYGMFFCPKGGTYTVYRFRTPLDLDSLLRPGT